MVVGEIFKNIKGEVFEVVEYGSHRKVSVKFLNTGHITTVTKQNLEKGYVRDIMSPSLCGVGVIGQQRISSLEDKLAYKYWQSLLKRCFADSKREHSRSKTYSDCVVCDSFLNFQTFKVWCFSQIGFGCEGYQLDKDVLFKGNKVYSPETCCFLPTTLNNIILTSKAIRGDLPIGVKKVGKKFSARHKDHKVEIHLGTFDNAEDAFKAYKIAKESYIRSVVSTYHGKIDQKAYEALMSWNISITD